MLQGRIAQSIRHCVFTAVALSFVPALGVAGEADRMQYTGSLKIDSRGFVRSMYNLSVAADGQSAADAGRAFLSKHARSLGIGDPAVSLKQDRIDHVPGGSHVRFTQKHRGIPVYGARVVVSTDERGDIRMLLNNTVPEIEVASSPSFDAQRAITLAREALRTGSTPVGSPDAAELMAYRAPEGEDHLIYRVTLTREEPAGDWEVLVDAESGSVLKTSNLFVEYQNGQYVQGQGHVFLADPLSVSRQFYGSGGFVDNDDLDSDPLTREEPAGDWEVLVDAESGSVLKISNLFVEYQNGQYVQGQGHVFLADPLSVSRQFYGSGGFVDNDDLDSDPLTASRRSVTLDSITYADGMFWLRGPYCEIVDIESPIDSAAAALAPDAFSFTRGEHGFEAVNAYYHVTASYKRLRDLGFSSRSLEQIRIDPHGFQGKDNSHYSPTGNWISFGTGGVDDAEDADVIWHEYGHAIQYAFAAGWGDGECAALGEGYADYWAASYSRWAGQWTKGESPYNWVYKWDGHNEFWSGRILNDQRTYPFGSLSAHTAGQIWSAALMGIWDELGRDVTDMLVMKSLFYLGTGSTAVDAAHAMLQADRDLFKGQHLPTLIYWLGTVKHFIDPASLPNISTDVTTPGAGTPETFGLDQNYPNPFNPSTTIQFTLGAAYRVNLRVYNVIGQEIAVVADGSYAAGSHTVRWDASGVGGISPGSSVYIARLTVIPSTGGEPITYSRKMILLR